MKRILAVDDSASARQMVSCALREAGYEVVEAVDGKDALAKITKGSFDLIVTDIIMPDMEGIELILRLRRRSRDLPIIAISGGGRGGPEVYLELARSCGAARVLAKPFEAAQLLSYVNEALQPCLVR